MHLIMYILEPLVYAHFQMYMNVLMWFINYTYMPRCHILLIINHINKINKMIYKKINKFTCSNNK